MTFLQSYVGKKILMAITGLFMLAFLLAHMLGNMTFHLGPEAINSYARQLQSLGPLLWVQRILLILVFILHFWLGLCLSLGSAGTGTAKYALRKYQRASPASRSMIYTGLIVLAFGIYHLLHLTFRVTNPEFYQFTDQAGHLDVYKMTGLSLSNHLISLVYFFGLAALLFHVWHGLGSFFQTMGWNNDTSQPLVERGSKIVALILFLAYLSIPASFLLFGL